MAFVFKINGESYASPSSLDFKDSDLSGEASGRALDGTMTKILITDKVNFSAEWKYLPNSLSEPLLQAIKSDVFIDVTYIDAKLGETTKTFYTGDLSYKPECNIGGTVYWTINVDFVEK